MIIIKNKATKGVFTKSKLTNVKGGRASYKSDDARCNEMNGSHAIHFQ